MQLLKPIGVLSPVAKRKPKKEDVEDESEREHEWTEPGTEGMTVDNGMPVGAGRESQFDDVEPLRSREAEHLQRRWADATQSIIERRLLLDAVRDEILDGSLDDVVRLFGRQVVDCPALLGGMTIAHDWQPNARSQLGH